MSGHAAKEGGVVGFLKTVFKGLLWALGIGFIGVCLVICSAIIGLSNIISPKKVGPPPPRFSDVAAVQTEADHSRALHAAVIDRNEANTAFDQWPTYRIKSHKAPIYKMVANGKVGKLEPMRSDPAGEPFLVLTNTGSVELFNLVPDSKGTPVTVIEPADVQPLYLTQDKWVNVKEEATSKPRYWDYDKPVYADLGHPMKFVGSPIVYVRWAQERADGTGYDVYWGKRTDLLIADEQTPPASWMRVQLRNGSEDPKELKVLDRYSAVLKPGQTTEMLTYQAPYEDEVKARKAQGWKPIWFIKATADVTVTFNGKEYLMKKDEFVDFDETNDSNGATILTVTALEDCALKQVLVEWKFCWQRIEAKQGDRT